LSSRGKNRFLLILDSMLRRKKRLEASELVDYHTQRVRPLHPVATSARKTPLVLPVFVKSQSHGGIALAATLKS
jgi:hypothetical protein